VRRAGALHLPPRDAATSRSPAAVVALDAIAAARRDGTRGAWRVAAPFAAAGAALALLYLPQLGNLRTFLAGGGAAPNHVLDLRPAVLHAIVDRWVSGPAWTAWLCEGAFAIGAVRLARRRDAAAAGVAAWLAAPFLLFGLVPFSKYFDLRFLISALPAFFLVVAAGIDAVARLAGRRRRAPRRDGRRDRGRPLRPALRLQTVFRDATRHCGDIVRDPAIFFANDRLCADPCCSTRSAPSTSSCCASSAAGSRSRRRSSTRTPAAIASPTAA
jgi:hypothetical protein